MAKEHDFVAQYVTSELGFEVGPRTVLVEGITDVKLFHLAAHLEREKTGSDLLSGGLTFGAAGERDRGGASGVIRELVILQGQARMCLLPNGRPRYRFIGLLDNDKAGNQAVKMASYLNASILEYKDVFRLFPVMPLAGNLDPGTLQKTFERENAEYKGLEWEIEDLLPQKFIDAFVSEYPGSVARITPKNGKIHRDLTRDGKARLHQFVKQNARHDDVCTIIDVLKALRFYLNL
jgi:hypothetical protein